MAGCGRMATHQEIKTMKALIALLLVCLTAFAADPYQLTLTNNALLTSTSLRFSSNEVLRARQLIIRGVVAGNITNSDSVKILFDVSTNGGPGIEILPGGTLTLDGGPLGIQLYTLRLSTLATNDGITFFVLP